MATRAALVFIFLAIVFVQLRFSPSWHSPQLYVVGFAPPSNGQPQHITSPPRHTSPYMMMPPRTQTIHRIEVDEATKGELLRYLDGSDLQSIQRNVLVSLFRISNKKVTEMSEVLADPAGEAAILAAAYEVFFIARDLFGGPVKDFVDTCMRGVMLTTKDAEKRVEILDTCFQAFPAEYKDTPVEDGLRLFRMLLLPHTADMTNAKAEVQTFTAKLNKDTAKSVEKWMRKMEAGKPEFLGPSDFAEDCLTADWDPMDVWMPMMPRKKPTPRSAADCYFFEESLRNYKAVVMVLHKFDL
jgi:hypothetical protein